MIVSYNGFVAAPIIIGPGTNGTEIGGVIPPGGDQNCKIRVPQEGATVKVRTAY